MNIQFHWSTPSRPRVNSSAADLFNFAHIAGRGWRVAILLLTLAAASPKPAQAAPRVANTTLRMPASPPGPGVEFPTNLAEASIFADLRTLTPNAGVVPYIVNVPLWSDGASKSRWFSLPDTNLTIGFSPETNWAFPTGMVWIKHFELELTNGVPASRRRLETRVLVRNATGVYGVTYRWDESQTNAVLVRSAGTNESFVIHNGGTTRTQSWRYPSSQECLQCHKQVAGYALGFNTPQLNGDVDYGEGLGIRNQIRTLSDAGYFNSPITNLHLRFALAPATNSAWSQEWRVRSYLDANCKQCHQPAGSYPTWDARITTPLPDAGLIGRLIIPGSTNDSVLLARVSRRSAGQMPPLATSVPDTQFIALLRAWITNDLPSLGTAPPHLPVFAPPSLNADGSIRLSFEFDPRWPYDVPMPGWTNVIEVSSDLIHWTPLFTNNAPGTIQWDVPNANWGFYRDVLRGAHP